MRTRGWALDDDGVAEVRVFVDGKYVASLAAQESRADVSAVHPQYAKPGDRYGWLGTVTLPGELASGEHAVLVQAVDSEGLTRDLGVVSIALQR